jgi:hypothetical protein
MDLLPIKDIFLQHIMKWSVDRCIALYEPPIIPSKAKKTPELCQGFRSIPLLNSFNIGGVCSYTLASDDMSQIFHFFSSK